MSENKKIKSISFNKKNENDKKILNHVARRNFSGYVKKLILADIEKKEQVKEQKKNPPNDDRRVKKEITIKQSTNVLPTKPYIPKKN
ncbi:MAG: hypothetical protein LPK00_03070 [Bacillaceae bacterium]|nr:hypothetical protein [Bacillaceae bacterium]